MYHSGISTLWLRQNSERRARFEQRRKLWLQVHLWLGWFAGAVFVLLGLTGSVNVFRWDIDEWLNPELIAADAGGAPKPLDQVLQTLRAAHPERSGSWSLELPRHPAGMLTARHFRQTGEGEPEILFVSVNPYTAQIVANRRYSDFGFLVTWIYRLHGTFFLGQAGWYAVGTLGLLVLVSLGSGLYLWWPKNGKWRQALTFKRNASRQRLVFDLHKLCGAYGLVVLLAIAFSGVCLVFADYVRPVVALFSPLYGGFNPQPEAPPGTASSPLDGAGPLPAEQAVRVAQQVFPEAQLRFVKTPAGPQGYYAVQLRQPGEASLFFTATSVWIDQYSGQVLAVRDPRRFTAGETFLNLMWPLHNGEALGTPGRIAVCAAGFFPLLLYVTGLMRWLQKRRAQGRKRAEAKPQAME